MKTKRQTKKFLVVLISVLTLWFVFHTVFIITDGLRVEDESFEMALILGTKVNEDGSLSERLMKRLDCGLDLYRAGRVDKLLVSGGFGSEGWYEAEKMRDYLVLNGIPACDIYVDNYGNDTEASINNCVVLSDSLKINSVVVVSQYFHITRSKMLLKKAGFKIVGGASPDYFELRDVYSVTREFFAFYAEVF